jgi:hypothetical protein
MQHATFHRRLPRAGIDTIDDAGAALSTLLMALHRPLRAETIVLVLDESRRGRTIVVVTGTHDPDSVIEVVECLTQGMEYPGAIVVGSVRPEAPDAPDAAPDPAACGDVDRWLEMSEIASLVGVELLEWFVIGRSVRCPRDELGEAPRW